MDLKGFFRFVASQLPIIAPDEGFEAALLRSHNKPVCIVLESSHLHDAVEVPARVTENLRELRRMVDRSEIGYSTVKNPDKSVWHIFAQNSCLEKMERIRMHLEATGNGAGKPVLSLYDFSRMLGYRRRDILLFSLGGYEGLPKAIRRFFQSTHDFRFNCYLEDRLER